MAEEVKHFDYGREHDLTADELRSLPVFAHVTNEQAAEIIATIKQFTRIMYDFYSRKNAEKALNTAD